MNSPLPLPVFTIPTDKPRPIDSTNHIENIEFTLTSDLANSFNSLLLHLDIDAYTVLLAVFNILLYRYTNQDEITLGTNICDEHAKNSYNNKLAGDLLVLDTAVTNDLNIKELLQLLQASISKALSADQAYANPSTTVCPILFLVQATLENYTLPYDLCLVISSDASETLNGRISFSTDLFFSSSIQRLVGHFLGLLQGIIEYPDAKLYQLPLLTEQEKQQILYDWNKTATDFPQDRFLHNLFEEQVTRSPNAIALIHNNQKLSYAELNARANQLAHHLITMGVGPDVLVGICVDRSLDMLVGLLGILKAGGAYVPIDPHHPKERLKFILEDSEISVLLLQDWLATLFDYEFNNIPIVDLSATCADWLDQPNHNPILANLKPEHLAYAIYTSGSTGKPKKAGVIHRGLQNLLPWYIRVSELDGSDAMLLVTSFAFDLSQRVIFGPLLAGSRLVLANEPFDPSEIVKLIAREAITMLNLTPSGFHALIDASTQGEFANVKRVFLGGEAMQAAKLLEIPEPRPKFVNNFGPTECTATATYFPVNDLELYRNRPVPIGKPIANAKIYILDTFLQPVPIGVTGELYIGGIPVGRGYLNQPGLTAERFLKDPFTDDIDARIYKTGDLGRWLADGNIDYLGRNDFQIKLRGFRIELGEIESALRSHPQLRDAVVIVHESETGEKRLAAYCIPSDIRPNTSDLYQHLKPLLPTYMIPTYIMLIDAYPLNRSGKLDRHALPTPTIEIDSKNYIAPVNETETQLVEIWKKLLSLSYLSTHDDFFDLGGTSLLAVNLALRIKQVFDIEIGLAEIYRSPTIHELAEKLFSTDQISWFSLVPVQTKGSRPPLFSIHTISLLDLPHLLGKEQPLYFLRYGMAAKVTDQNLYLPLIEELAAQYIAEMQQAQPKGPYHLMGFSFGGLLAYEMACQLNAKGEQVALLCLLDTYLTHDKTLLPLSTIICNLFSLSAANICQKIVQKVKTFFATSNTAPIFDPHFYSAAPDRFIRQSYQHKLYSGPVTLIQASSPEKRLFHVYENPEHAWRKLLGKQLKVHSIPGEHYTIFSEQNVQSLAEKISDCMTDAIQTNEPLAH